MQFNFPTIFKMLKYYLFFIKFNVEISYYLIKFHQYIRFIILLTQLTNHILILCIKNTFYCNDIPTI